MRAASFVALLLLSGCLGAPAPLPPGHPAANSAPPGLVVAPAALDDYRSAEDFAARAATPSRPARAVHPEHQH